MTCFIKCKLLVVAILMAATVTTYAQNSSDVENAVKGLVAKYERTKGVEAMSVAKGNGLELVKMMLNKEFGKSFTKGVKSITIIDYTDSSQEICNSLRKDLDVFLTFLQEFDLSEEKSFSGNDFIRCFADVQETTSTLSDFVIVIEEEKSKMLMYMAGKINID